MDPWRGPAVKWRNITLLTAGESGLRRVIPVARTGLSVFFVRHTLTDTLASGAPRERKLACVPEICPYPTIVNRSCPRCKTLYSSSRLIFCIYAFDILKKAERGMLVFCYLAGTIARHQQRENTRCTSVPLNLR